MSRTDERVEGTLVSWDEARGFGFASVPSETRDIFVHVKFLRSRHVAPAVGDTLRFEVTEGRNGRPAAADIEIVGAPPPPPSPEIARSHPSAVTPAPTRAISVTDVSRLAAAVSIMIGAWLAVASGYAPTWFGALYPVMGLGSGLMYWLDKRYALHGRSRVREISLHLADALFGIGGGLFAQHVFRHKIRKRGFRAVTRLIFVGHASLLIAAFTGLLRLDTVLARLGWG